MIIRKSILSPSLYLSLTSIPHDDSIMGQSCLVLCVVVHRLGAHERSEWCCMTEAERAAWLLLLTLAVEIGIDE